MLCPGEFDASTSSCAANAVKSLTCNPHKPIQAKMSCQHALYKQQVRESDLEERTGTCAACCQQAWSPPQREPECAPQCPLLAWGRLPRLYHAGLPPPPTAMSLLAHPLLHSAVKRCWQKAWLCARRKRQQPKGRTAFTAW